MRCGELRRRLIAQSQPQDVRLPCAHLDRVVRCRLGAAALRIHGLAATVHDVIVDAVLHVRRAVRRIRDALRIGLILCEQQFDRILAVNESLAELRMIGADAAAVRARGDLAQHRRLVAVRPGPGVAEPESGQDVQRRGLRPAVAHGDLDQDVLGRRLRILDEHVEVAVVVEDSRIEQLVFQLVAAPCAVGAHQVGVRIGALWIFVEILQIGMGRRRVEIEVVLLHVLAVIALAVREPKQPLLQDRIGSVPQRQRDAQPLLVIAQARQTVLTPAIRPRAGLVVREVVPRVPAVAVVLAHGSPLTLAQVRTPASPRCRAGTGAAQSF